LINFFSSSINLKILASKTKQAFNKYHITFVFNIFFTVF
jgi:hypothetical protein